MLYIIFLKCNKFNFSGTNFQHALESVEMGETPTATSDGKIPILVKRPRDTIVLEGLPPTKFGPLELAVSTKKPFLSFRNQTTVLS